MKKGLIAFAALTVLFGVIIFSAFVELNNTCISNEKSIQAQFEQNKNNYDNYFKKLKEVAQVPEMYVEGLKDVYNTAMSGRYGDGGSKAVFQWLQEQNPQIDASIYKQIQQVIEAGRNDFESNQKMLIDKKRIYEVYYQQFPNSVIASILGFPKIDLDIYSIVTSELTETIFTNKESTFIKL